MSSLSQLRTRLATRLGFGSQNGAQIIQGPMLDSILQSSQDLLIDRYGTQIGSTIPAAPFTDPNDEPSVPEYPLFLKSLLFARQHYNQPKDVDSASWDEWKRGIRGIS